MQARRFSSMSTALWCVRDSPRRGPKPGGSDAERCPRRGGPRRPGGPRPAGSEPRSLRMDRGHPRETHAHMTLSIIPHLRESLISFSRGECMFYGYNRVRFPAPVPVGARVRMYGTVVEALEIDGGQQLTLDVHVEVRAKNVPAAWRRQSGDTMT